MLPVERENNPSVSPPLFTAHTCPSSPHLCLADLYRCATMKPHAPATPPGRGQTVACLIRPKSLRPLRKKDPRVGFHLFQPLVSHAVIRTRLLELWFTPAYNRYCVFHFYSILSQHQMRVSQVYWGHKHWRRTLYLLSLIQKMQQTHSCAVHLMRGDGEVV